MWFPANHSWGPLVVLGGWPFATPGGLPLVCGAWWWLVAPRHSWLRVLGGRSLATPG